MLTLTTITGCFMPPPLELEADGGNVRVPEVRKDVTTPEIGKAFTHYQTADAATTKRQKEIVVGLLDEDSSTLHARVFINGNYDQLVEGGDRTASGCTQGCAASFTLGGLCDQMVNDVLGTHVLEVWVSDLPWPDNSENNDLHVLHPDAFGTNVLWQFTCEEASKAGDADGGVN